MIGISVGELAAMDFAEPEQLLGPWLTRNNLVLLYAPTGIGKTFFALNVAHAVCTAGEFLKWKAPAARRVCLFDGEMGIASLGMRLKELDTARPDSIRANAMRIVTFEHFGLVMPNLASDEGQEIYTQAAEGCDLLIIDNLLSCARAESSRDTEFQQWERVQRWAIRMRQSGKTVLFIHHAGKSGTQLGTSARGNIMDTIVNLRRPKVQAPDLNGFECEMHFEKTRNFYGLHANPVYIRAEGGRWNWLELGDQLKEQVRTLHLQGQSPRDIAAHMGLSVGYVKNMLGIKSKPKKETEKTDEFGIF